jgi:hypothetical protein
MNIAIYFDCILSAFLSMFKGFPHWDLGRRTIWSGFRWTPASGDHVQNLPVGIGETPALAGSLKENLHIRSYSGALTLEPLHQPNLSCMDHSLNSPTYLSKVQGSVAVRSFIRRNDSFMYKTWWKKGLLNLHFYPFPGARKMMHSPRQNPNTVLVHSGDFNLGHEAHSFLVLKQPRFKEAYCPHASSCQFSPGKQINLPMKDRSLVEIKTAKKEAVSPPSSILKMQISLSGYLRSSGHILLSSMSPQGYKRHNTVGIIGTQGDCWLSTAISMFGVSYLYFPFQHPECLGAAPGQGDPQSWLFFQWNILNGMPQCRTYVLLNCMFGQFSRAKGTAVTVQLWVFVV